MTAAPTTARFTAYVQLPRFQPSMNHGFGERPECQRHPAHLTADYSAATLLPAVGADEPLVRSYLKQFFADDTADTREYEPYLDHTRLRNVYAETKIELGAGDPEQWASRLSPEFFRALKDRVGIDFAFTNQTDFAADEPVALDLHVKNAPALIVKVFEINTKTVYRTRVKEVDTDITLDGLVANAEKVHKYDDSPFRRQDRRFAFPELNKPGVYVIDFIGAGKSSRALVRKGHLRPVVTTGPAGQNIRVVDEKNRPVDDATVWLAGVEYAPDKDGVVTVPYTAQPGRPVVISRGEFAALDSIEHRPETYRLAAGIHADRESPLTQRVAPLVIRAGLFVNDTPVLLKLLEDVRLRITSIDHSDIPTSAEVPNFQLFEDREAVHEIRVPARLKALSVQLTANVKNLNTGKSVDLTAGRAFALNEVERTDRVEDLHLAKFGPDYVVEVLGRIGEPKPDRPVALAVKHQLFKNPVHVTLKTDPAGRVHLGPLADIATVTATGPEGTSHNWALSTDADTYRKAVHAKAGEVVALPYLGTACKPTREELALFEVSGATVRADRFDALAVVDGAVELRGLAPGDYDLHLKTTNERVRVRVVAGEAQAGHVLGSTRHLQLPGLRPVHIQSVTAAGDDFTIRLRDHSRFARVHVFATRYQPAFDAFADLARVRDAELGGVVPGHAESVYLTGRNIGDEYRYVLDRKGMRKYPGNMPERPMLLLNPWAVRTTETGGQHARMGQGFAAGGRFQPPVTVVPATSPEPNGGWAGQAGPGDFANLDFLADASAVLLNLVPDKDGVIKLAAKDVGPHAVIRVVAVDPLGTTSRTVALGERAAGFVDLRLKNGLDPARHTPGDADTLAVAYYLLLQDRVEEANEAFARVNPERVATRMQYDYCAAYLEMFRDEPRKARAIATAYQHHPVDRWRNTFSAVLAQLDEIEGKGPKVVPGEEHNQNQGNLAATEPGFEVTVGAQGVNLTWQNVEAVRVNYYLMDVELLFSTSPFVQKAGGQFATIKPNASEVVKLPAGRTKHTHPLPAEFEGRNVLVEVTAAGKTRSVPRLATTMTATLSENYGQLKVTETAGGKAYVKVYAKLADGSVKFHKDGYTDLRGRFDYASVNTPERLAMERFAVLVPAEVPGCLGGARGASPGLGAAISVPQGTGRDRV